ncbi:ribonuclease H family protein [Bombilactobacillus folatiphilus]|uniref:ribonuclease H n=1 Tax=Bombilactobacillus folatiphilus TaxID=2923362 RepID=A0ABY4P9B6_9LACO|nr:ribonuclease H family protein [Bombilactobacillus folatiphilus]UQS82211.1 ribonuclease H family protein [Bombilactobacillus folatiphilus]
MKKYYAVKSGRQPGIYQTWADCQRQVTGFSGAQFKSFVTLAQAQAFLESDGTKSTASTSAPTPIIQLYTDGGTRNTGNVHGGHVNATDKAAWAYLIVTPAQRYSDSQGCLGATNNQMELLALLQGLKQLINLNLQYEAILVTMDSRYVLNAINKHWLQNWQRRGWKKADGQPVLNVQLWQAFVKLLPTFPRIQFVWTKGHADNAGNVFVDRLLNKTMDDM